jgi:hypothetical protein
MYRYPFTLISYELLTPEGKPLFRRPVWLAVFGPRRDELSPQTLVQLYMRRFDIEHCFRFCKRNLLLTASQTPKVNHEEHWADLVLLAYTQLWLARELAQTLRQPWQDHLKQPTSRVRTPAQVQRDFTRIIRRLGTPASAPKVRGKSPGWPKGWPRKRRLRRRVVVKAKKVA